VGLQDEAIFFQMAPPAGEAIAMFEEVNRPFEFVGPSIHDDSPFRFVDQYKRRRLDQRIHRPVFAADIGVTMRLQIQPIQQHEGESAPPLNHAAQVGGLFEIDSGIEAKRKLDFALILDLETDEVCPFDFDLSGIGGQLRGIDAIPLQSLTQVEAVNCAQAVQTKDRRNCPFIFNVGKSRQGYYKFVVLSAFGDSKTGIFDVPVAEIQSLPHPFQALACIVHDMMLSRKLNK